MINNKRKNKRTLLISVIAFNVSILAILVAVLSTFSINSNKRQYESNLHQLENDTVAISTQLQFYFEHQYNNMLSKKKYIQNSENAFTRDSAMKYLSSSNYSDYQLYQLVDQLPTFYSEEGGYTTNPAEKEAGTATLGRRFYSTATDQNGDSYVVNGYYTSTTFSFFSADGFSMDNIDDSIINTTGQFTLPIEYYVNGEKRAYATAVALYTSVTLPASGEQFLLFCTVALQDVLASGVPTVTYDRADTVLLTTDGRFISKTNQYLTGSNNTFLSYLKEVYGYESTAPGEIIAKLSEEESGTLDVKTGRGENTVDAVLTYRAIKGSNWVYLAIVPVASLESVQDLSYAVIMIIFLLFLVIVDFAVIANSNSRLKASLLKTEEAVVRERVANASKSSFLSRMSHEIRTPLNAVIGYNLIAKTAISDATDEATHRQAEMKVLDCLSKSEIASRHLLNVINDVLDMSAIESDKLKIASEKFDFRGLITSLTIVFYSQAKAKGIEFQVLFDTLTSEWFMGDQMRVNQVLTNLLSNAIKFTPEGGSVLLKITQTDSEADIANVTFEIIDTGIGMTEEYMSHIWKPFEQADSTISRRFGGSGLGLSITKSLVDLMKGEISVASTPGEGTTFTVKLSFGLAAQPIPNSGYDFSSINMLVVDDDVSTCDYIRLLFNRCGAQCATVYSGEDAIRAVTIAQEKGRQYTACLVDWKMPYMDGIETIRRIREIVGDEVLIIVLTAYDYTEVADRAVEIGVTRFVSKPLFQSSLFDMLANLCGRQVEKPARKDEKYDFSGVKVILAEDNMMNMEIAATILKSVGITVEKAWNGREAVDLFLASKPGDYSLILMDVHMPEMNGHEATGAIRSSAHPQAKTIPIIAMTADAFAENVAEAYSYGMNGHIAKPIDVSTLFETIKKYVG